MTQVGTYLSTPSTSVGRCSTDRDIPASPHDSQESEEGASPTSPGEKPGLPSFKCPEPDCSTRCTTKRTLKRHQRLKHQPNSSKPCLLDCNHRWTREYDFRNHLKGRKHRLSSDEIDKILGGPLKRRRRKDRVTKSDPLPHFSPPPIERASPDEPQQRPLSPPVRQHMAYNPQLGYAEVTTIDPLSEEDIARLTGRLDEFRLQSAQPGGSTTADLPPNHGMCNIPVSEDPMVEPSRSTDPMVADYREIGTYTSTAVDGFRVDSILTDVGWAGAAGPNWDLEP